MTVLLAAIPGVAYAVRRSTHAPAEIRRTRKAIRTAFEAQALGLGLAIVEILSTCPTNWRLTPEASLDYIRDHVALECPPVDFEVHPQLA